jgi:CRISPR-associated protein Cas2
MLELAPGIYISPRMSRSVRERVWQLMEAWYADLGGGSIVLTWYDRNALGRQQVLLLGTPPKELYDADGIFLTRRQLT